MVPTIKMCCHPIPWMLKFVWLLKCFCPLLNLTMFRFDPLWSPICPDIWTNSVPACKKKLTVTCRPCSALRSYVLFAFAKNLHSGGCCRVWGGGCGGHAFFAAHLYPCCNYRCIASSFPGLSWFTVWQLYKYHWLKIHMGTAVVIKCNKRLIEEINFNKISLKQQYK